MAKRTAKEWKCTLPVADRIIYWILLFVILALLFVGVFAFIQFWKNFAFRDPEVVAARARASVLLGLPAYTTTMLLMFIPWAICYSNNKRIIGGQWLKRKPKFQPQKPFCTERSDPEYLAKKAKRKRKERWGKFLLGSVLVSLVLMIYGSAFLSPWGRDVLETDGGIKRYNMFNSVSRQYDSEDATSVELDCVHYKRNRRSQRRWTVFIRITHTDGKEYSFTEYDFKGHYLQEIAALKEQFDPSVITYSNVDKLGAVIKDQHLNDEDSALLYALFDIQK